MNRIMLLAAGTHDGRARWTWGARVPGVRPITRMRRQRLKLGQLALHKSPVDQLLVTSYPRRAASLLWRSSSVVSPPPSGIQPGGRIT